MDVEQDDEHGQAADGEVDVETPSPGDVFCKGTAEEGACDGGDSPHAAYETEYHGAFLERHWVLVG